MLYLYVCLNASSRISCLLTVSNTSKKQFCTTFLKCKEVIEKTKKRSSSSQKWLLRQINDQYVKKAKSEHYRCRSAFKLLEIDKMYKIFKKGQTVIDLGCSPGSWSQVAVNSIKANLLSTKSLVIGVDLSPVHPIEGATLVGGLDFRKESSQEHILSLLGCRRADVVLSDMAPAATGVKSLDHENIVELCYAALGFAQKTSAKGSTLVMKFFHGPETNRLKNDVQTSYHRVHLVRPEASRKESSEIFFVCLNFKDDDRANGYESEANQAKS